MAAPGPTTLWGRSGERQRLDDALEAVRSGKSAVLVVRGEAGIGKTALLEYAAAQATDCSVARISGVESELELPYAALHQLCAPLLGELATLPEPQEHALQVTFGLASGDAPDRFLVGLAVLSLLAEAAAKRPLVCLVDDTQWLDQASRQVLGVAGRRLLAESVLLLFGVREADEDRLLPGLPELTVRGLDADDARLLLAAAVTGPLDDGVRDRLVAETGGNPLALLELVNGTSEAELAGGFAIPSTAILSPRASPPSCMTTTCSGCMPCPSRRGGCCWWRPPTPPATRPCCGGRPRPSESARDAAASGEVRQLLEIGSTVRFRHPLMRSAAYAAGSAEDRRAAHLALAAATDARTDPDRRAWHLATAASWTGRGRGHRARAVRGAGARARGSRPRAAFLERSVALTPEPERRTDRALAAAHANLHAGSVRGRAGAAGRRRGRRGQRPPAGPRGAATRGDRPGLHLGQPRPGAAARGRHSGWSCSTRRLARETYLDAWGAALVAGHLAEPGGTLHDVSAAARAAAAELRTAPRPRDLLLEGLATMIARRPRRRRAEPATGRGRLRRRADVGRALAALGCAGVERGTRVVGHRLLGPGERPPRRARPDLRRAGAAGCRVERAPGGGHLVRGLRDRDLAGRRGTGWSRR